MKIIRKGHEIVEATKELPINEFIDCFIKAAINVGALDNVPIASTIVGLSKTYRRYKEERFKKNFRGFLDGAGEMSEDNLEKIRKISSSPDEPHFLESLIETIESSESEQKTKILGAAFRRFIDGRIDRPILTDQIRITKSMYIVDIFHLMHGYHNDHFLEDRIGDVLVNHHICKRSIRLVHEGKGFFDKNTEPNIKIKYEITPIGQQYLITLHAAYRDKIEEKYLLIE